MTEQTEYITEQPIGEGEPKANPQQPDLALVS